MKEPPAAVMSAMHRRGGALNAVRIDSFGPRGNPLQLARQIAHHERVVAVALKRSRSCPHAPQKGRRGDGVGQREDW